MNYKDQSFEINENQIKFKNNTFFIYVIIFFSIGTFAFFSHWLAIIGLQLLDCVSVLLQLLGFSFHFIGKTPLISLKFLKLKQVFGILVLIKIRTFGVSRNINIISQQDLIKKTTPRVIFVQRRNKKLAVGFVPDNCNKVISILQDRGISIIKETFR